MVSDIKVAEVERALKKKSAQRHDENGFEHLDPTPIAPPINFRRQPSMVDHIRNLVRSERLRQEAMAAGFETFEEADDFSVGDDFDPTSPYEDEFEPEGVREVRKRVEEAEKAALEKVAPPANSEPSGGASE